MLTLSYPNTYLFHSFCINIFIFISLISLSQQAVEDLLEDEDEDFDKDDKVIMSCVRDTFTHKHVHQRHCLRRGWHCFIYWKYKQTDEMSPSSPPISSPVQLFSLPKAPTYVKRLYNLLTSWKVFSLNTHIAHFSPVLLVVCFVLQLSLQFSKLSLNVSFSF